MSQPALLTPGEAAAALRVAPRTLKVWVKAGKLHAVLTVGGHARYRRVDIERLAQGPIEAAS